MKEVAGMEGNVWLLWAVAWPFLAAFISLFAEKRERGTGIFCVGRHGYGSYGHALPLSRKRFGGLFVGRILRDGHMAEGGRIQVAVQYHRSLHVDDDHSVSMEYLPATAIAGDTVSFPF